MNTLLEGLRNFGNLLVEDPLYLLLTVLFVATLVLIGFVISLSRRIDRLMKGQKAKSLEGVIFTLSNDIEKMKEWRNTANNVFKDLNERVMTSVRGTSLVRFNPFKGTGSGGNQSFSAAFLDEDGNGVVLSSLYSRERVSMFGKPLEKFSSTFELTEEEKQAVKEAKESLS